MITITTTAGEWFTNLENVDMARLIFKRFGRDIEEAHSAWKRLLENDCTLEDFKGLVYYEEHTPHCDGHCLS